MTNLTSGIDVPGHLGRRSRHVVVSLVARPLCRVLEVVGRRACAHARGRLSGPAAPHLSRVVESFLCGYVTALQVVEPDTLAWRLTQLPATFRGFAFEGASMALALLDTLCPVRPLRLQAFVRGAAEEHIYMAYVGAGWAAARLGVRPERAMRRLDPLLGWLAIDGYGFHQALFHPRRVVEGRAVMPYVDPYTARVLDQGVGRALWFVDFADVRRIADRIGRFAPARRGDLWSGVALAATYAGGVGVDDLLALRACAAGHEQEIAQGAAFAAEARVRANLVVSHTETASRIFAGVAPAEGAFVVRRERAVAAQLSDGPAYESWRRRVGSTLVKGSH